MDQTIMIIAAVIAVIVVVIIAYFVSRARKEKKAEVCPIDINALIAALGGKDNIVESHSSPSTLKVKLKSQDHIVLEDLKNLGASGVVQGEDTVTMIFGSASAVIEKTLNQAIS